MAIFRCNKCKYIKEVPNKYINEIVKCPKCTKENKVYETIVFAKKVISIYTSKQEEINIQKENIKQLNDNINKQKKEIDNLNTKIILSNKNVDNISNSEEFILEEDYKLIVDWFNIKKINVEINLDAVDTRGFFDEVAILLGNNFHILDKVLDQIRYIQRKGYDTVKILLENKTKEEIAIIKNFSQEVYDYSFVTRYFYDRKKNAVYLELQKATKIVNFFNGMWLEWYIYMMLLDFLKEKQISHKIIRDLKITYSNGEKHELDLFLLVNNTPICIECKIGEFRRDLDKYIKIKKHLKVDKEQFIICIVGLSKNQTDGFTNTYDITFTNQNNILEHINNIISKS